MNPYTQLVTLNGVECYLLLLPHNVDKALTLQYDLPSAVDEQVSGIESRRAMAAAPMLTLSYDCFFSGTGAQLVRSVLGDLAGKRVAIPIWPDLSDAAGWASRVHLSQCNVGYDLSADTPNNVATTTDGSMPAGAYKAPLVIGWLERPEAELVTGDALELTIKVREDSPWTHRVEPLANAPESFVFTANWRREPKESSRDLIRTVDFGEGRFTNTEGDAITKWQQSGLFTQVDADFRSYLAYWTARQKDQASFTLDSSIKAGAETPQAPHVFDGADGIGKMRFKSDRLTVSYYGGLYEFTQAFSQEVVNANQPKTSRARLVKLFQVVDGAEVAVNYFTTWDAPISALSQTWQPMSGRLRVSELKLSLQVQKESVTIECSMDDVALAKQAAEERLEFPIHCEIWDAILTTPTVTTHKRFSGTLKKPTTKGKKVTLEFSLFGSKFSQKLPRVGMTRNCPFTLFSAGCIRRNPSDMAKANWRWRGTYKDFWAGTENKLLLDTIIAPPETELSESKLVGNMWGSQFYDTNHTYLHALDGDSKTAFAGKATSNVFFAIDLGEWAQFRVTQIKYRPHAPYESRMNGAKFQAANLGDFSDAVDLYTVSGTPTNELHTVAIVNMNRFRFLRYFVNNGTHGNVAEVEFHGRKLIKPVSPQGSYFANGWVRMGTGADVQVRDILDSFTVSNEIHLVIDRPFLGDLTDVEFEFWPGCSGGWGECRNKFNNGLAFIGLSNAPGWFEEVAQSLQTKGK